MLVNVTDSYLITVICVSEPFRHFYLPGSKILWPFSFILLLMLVQQINKKIPLYLSQNFKDVLCNPYVQTNIDHWFKVQISKTHFYCVSNSENTNFTKVGYHCNKMLHFTRSWCCTCFQYTYYFLTTFASRNVWPYSICAKATGSRHYSSSACTKCMQVVISWFRYLLYLTLIRFTYSELMNSYVFV